MLRFLLFLGALMALIIVPSATRFSLEPIISHSFAIQSRPIALNESDPHVKVLGPLHFVGGWVLTSEAREFGSLSGMIIQGDHFLGVTDFGGLMEFDLTKGKIKPLPRGCGSRPIKYGQDAESIAVDSSGVIRIGLEGRQSICTLRSGTATATEVAPAIMSNWRRNGGAEAMAITPDGGLLVFAEQSANGIMDRALAYFPKPPVDRDMPARSLRYLPPRGYNPTDAVTLPDGRLLIINRALFPTEFRFSGILAVVDKPDYREGATLRGREVARIDPPIATDNYEGIAARETPEGTEIWLLSDDNFMPFQRTLLMKFLLPKGARL